VDVFRRPLAKRKKGKDSSAGSLSSRKLKKKKGKGEKGKTTAAIFDFRRKKSGELKKHPL